MNINWGYKLRDLIKAKGYMLKDVANAINESPQNLSNWCNDPHPMLENLEKVLSFLNVSLSDFFQKGDEEAKKFEMHPRLLNIIKYVSTFPDPVQEAHLQMNISFLEVLEKIADHYQKKKKDM